jgi:hypothetical protein
VTDTGSQQAVVVRDQSGGLASTVVGLVLRPAHASTPQRVALLLVALLALGPIAAALTLLGQQSDPIATVVAAPAERAPEEIVVKATIIGVDAVNGELRVRLVPEPGDAHVDGGVVTSDLTVRTGALSGPPLQTFPVGSVINPFEVALPLEGGNVSRYPFDGYDAVVSVAATADGDVVPVRLWVESVSLDHRISAEGPVTLIDEFGLAGAQLSVERDRTTVLYAVGVMALMWMFAVSGVLVSWATVIWRVEPPFWVYGFFVGVLFALPPLRNSMPGDPPPGTVVDVVAFYWSIAAVGITLLLLMASWLRDTRSARAQMADQPPAEGPLVDQP